MKLRKTLVIILLTLLLIPAAGRGMLLHVAAEEEEEYIPEVYYDPIQTNELPGWPQGPMIQAAAGIVMDLDTDSIVYAKNITTAHYPASITKIMTTLVALERGNLDDVITCGEEVYDIEADSSNLGIKPGEQLTLRQALYGLMLESANDIGNAVAVYIAGSENAYADLMNQKARELGCVNTHFTNPHGLHNEDHYTCAQDMAKIAAAAYENETFREIVSTRESMIPVTNLTDEERYFMNHQKLMQPTSDYYQEWCTGGKTGFTTDAWNTLVTYGEKDDKRYVCVILRENGADKSYSETTALMNYAFDQFHHVNVSESLPSGTFYDILGLKCPTTGTTIYPVPGLNRKVVRRADPGMATLPEGVGTESLTSQSSGGRKGNLQYLYNGWPVGSGSFRFNKIPFNTARVLPFQHGRDMDTLLALSNAVRDNRTITQTAQDVWNDFSEISQNMVTVVKDFFGGNRMVVLLAGGFLLLILLILIIILILRISRESRLLRRRRAEEKAMLRRAEEIDRKSAQEIEAELRGAMQAERARREKERRRRAEAEAEEAKLRETEELLREIRDEHFDVRDRRR